MVSRRRTASGLQRALAIVFETPVAEWQDASVARMLGSVAAPPGASRPKPFLWVEVQLDWLHHGPDLKDAKPDMGWFSSSRDRPVNMRWSELVGFPWFDSCFYNGVPGSGG